jgi:hypothetical protein
MITVVYFGFVAPKMVETGGKSLLKVGKKDNRCFVFVFSSPFSLLNLSKNQKTFY